MVVVVMLDQFVRVITMAWGLLETVVVDRSEVVTMADTPAVSRQG